MAEGKQHPLPYFIHKVFTLAQNDLLYHRQIFIEDSVTSMHKILKHNCPINLTVTEVPMPKLMRFLL